MRVGWWNLLENFVPFNTYFSVEGIWEIVIEVNSPRGGRPENTPSTTNGFVGRGHQLEYNFISWRLHDSPGSKVHGSNTGPIWDRQD